MDNSIRIWGIETNNLKNIDITLKKNAINLIIGPSGSGKSSLAYDTIAQIGQHEFMSMFADNTLEPTYKVKGYNNMLAAVPIKQTNYNNNTRSTIGTYFGLNKNIGFIYAALLKLSEDFFVLNKESNLCEICHGVGYVKELDVNRIINFNLPLKDDPVRCWDRYKEFYKKIIVEYCKDVGIDSYKTFRQLSEKEQHLFLYGESERKYKILYKKVNANSSRTTKYSGVMLKKPLVLGTNISDKYYSDITCPCCNGKKYSSEHNEYKLEALSIGEYMTTPFSELVQYNKKIRKKNKDILLDFSFEAIDAFLQKAIEFNLGHLFFHRSIPTLSGGELQRLRMVQVFNTQLSDLMIVLDEPLGGLSGDEKIVLYNSIVKLSKRHTLIIVDHSDIFASDAALIIALGEQSGKNGGRLIDPNNYLKLQLIEPTFNVDKSDSYIHISLKNNIYQYSGVDLKIAKNSLNLITGKSGVGKSTLIREYFPQYFESYLYINQKPLLGNKNSNVATLLDISTAIFEEFANKFKKSKELFSNNTGSEGCCNVCMGAGYTEYGSEKDATIRLECSECNGTGFNKNLKKYKLHDKSIFDVWKLTIDEAIIYFNTINSKITSKLKEATSIMLGHLLVGQLTSTLSGGENIRIKLLKSKNSKATVLGIDEPFKGLSNCEVCSVIEFLYSLKGKDKTVVVIDHNEYALSYFQNHIELTVQNGVLLETK